MYNLQISPPISIFFFLFYFCIWGPDLWSMEVPRLGVESELQLLAYTTGTAMPDPSHICDLHRSSWQCWIHNPLSGAKDRTRILMDTSWVFNPLSHNGNSSSHVLSHLFIFFFKFFLLEYSWFTILCQFLLHRTVTQSYLFIHSFSHTIFHHGLSQETWHSSLCYTVALHCPSIPNVIVCIYQSQTPHPSNLQPYFS